MKRLTTLILMLLFGWSPETIDAQTIPSPIEDYYSSAEWRSIGPYRGGRSCAVTGVAGKPNLFYFGSTGGGIWKSQNGGQSWENISDGYFGGSIGSIAVAPSDNNVIYVGGGEKTVRGNVSSGYGIWKSEDAGKSWTSLGLEQSKHVSRMRVHPSNPDIVYAAVMGNLYAPHEQRGVFKSTDGGQTWEKTLYINDEVGVVDLCIDPGNPRVLYASSWRIKRTPYSLESGGPGSGIFKSTDSGETWTEITGNEGLPKGVWGISAIAVSHQNSERVYCLMENDKGGVYRSEDGGKTWAKMNDSRALRQRAWYYTRIYTDTHDPDGLYVVNVSYHKSVDGGKTFEAANAPHGDHHDLWIAPEDPNRMIIGDDGGAQVTYDGGENWSTYHNQPTAQFYRVTTDNAFPYRIYAAQQDNSTIRIDHRSSGRVIGSNNWESTAGGESAHIAVDPNNSDIVYGGSYGGFLTRVDHELNTTRAINVWPDNPMGYGAEGMRYRFQWNFPIFFSKHDSNKLYTTSNRVHMSTDQGQSWQFISPDLTRNDPEKLKSSGGPITQDNTGVEYYCTIFAAAESALQEGLIWVGSDDGLVHVTRDGGGTWDDVTPKQAPEFLMINSIEPDPRDPATCYIAGTYYKGGDFNPYIYKTSDYGKSWTKIVTGINKDHFTRVVRVDPYVDDILYAGTESGMYVSFNDGQQWHPYQLNMPVVPITDLTIKDKNLIAATQGRSLYIVDDMTVLHQAVAALATAGDRLYKPLDAWRYGRGQNKKAKGVGLNHPSGVMVHYLLEEYEEGDSLSFTIYEEDGDLIRTYSTTAKEKADKLEDIESGNHLFNWNMKYPDAKKFDGMIMWAGSMAGPTAPPGNYRVEMSHKGKTMSQPFVIKGNPNLPNTDEDYQNQFDFVQSVNNKVTEAHEAIIEMRSIKKQLNQFKESMSDHPDIVENISDIDSTLSAIEKELYQTKNQSRQDPLNFPIKLTNKLAHLNSLTQRGSFPPTDAATQVRDELSGKIDMQLEKYNSVKENGIPRLNQIIRDRQVDYIKLKPSKKKVWKP